MAARRLSSVTTANEALFDALVRHQIYLLRLSGGMQRRVRELLSDNDKDIALQIERTLLNHKGPVLSSVRLERLRKYLAATRLKSWSGVTELWLKELQELSREEPTFVSTIMQTVAPVQLSLLLPAPSTLNALVTANPFQGEVLKEWSKKLAADELRRIMQSVRIGMVQGESSTQIARRIVGTAALRGKDGVMEITRRGAEALTRTLVNGVSNAAKQELYKANADILKEELFVATLDSRTTPVCRARDGTRWPVGVGPIPPLHWACRSLRVAVFDFGVLGERPFKAATEQQLLREFSEQKGIAVPSRRGRLPRGTRGQYDAFARRRIRELTGQTPASVNYDTWLRRQTAEFQDGVLGKARGKLFRNNGFTLDKFVNRAGDELTLAQLRSLYNLPAL